MYAIVDIETTGGYAANNDITEVAIVLHDGKNVLERFETLIKPLHAIPYYIQVLTGITPQLVEEAPLFEEVAARIYEMLQGHVFVAHNVNFDYSFLKHHLAEAGYTLNNPKLCTVRLSRKVFPGLPSYSLGNLCRSFNISVRDRHRAGGDTDATVELLEHLLANGAEPHIRQFLKKNSKEQSLPPHLSKDVIEQLPYTPGVYYFHDRKGKVIYVGKARNLKYRVSSHFTHNGAGRQRQAFLQHVHNITFQHCGTELMAFILESIEIRRLWPAYNQSLKRFVPNYALYSYEDQQGYRRLIVEKKKKHLQPLYTFNLLWEGQRLLQQLVKQFNLCGRLCFVQKGEGRCAGLDEGICYGACEQLETAEAYNKRVAAAVSHLEQALPTFAVLDEGNHVLERSCILVERGKFVGMGYVPADSTFASAHELKAVLTPYPESDYIRGLIYQYVERSPHTKLSFG